MESGTEMTLRERVYKNLRASHILLCNLIYQGRKVTVHLQCVHIQFPSSGI